MTVSASGNVVDPIFSLILLPGQGHSCRCLPRARMPVVQFIPVRAAQYLKSLSPVSIHAWIESVF